MRTLLTALLAEKTASRMPLSTMVILACAMVAFCPRAPSAEDVTVPTLKAAFLMNFVKFAEWPQGAVRPGQVFTFCVTGDQSVFKEIALSIKRNSRPDLMAVSSVPWEGPLTGCQMLYLGGSDLQAARRIVDALQGEPVFTASDIDRFAEAGGIAQLRLENGMMRFTINAAAAHRARIQLSAKLLSLATLVKEPSHDPR
jgi:uncharacterized protein DUF4154